MEKIISKRGLLVLCIWVLTVLQIHKSILLNQNEVKPQDQNQDRQEQVWLQNAEKMAEAKKAAQDRINNAGVQLTVQLGHSGTLSSVAFSPNGQMILTGGWDKKACLWEVVTGRELKNLGVYSWYVTSVAFSPNGQFALVGSLAETKLWDVATGKEVFQLGERRSLVNTLTFTPDGRFILTCSWDKSVRLWDATTGKEVRQFVGHTDMVDTLAISPNGELVLTGSRDKTIRLWEFATGKEIRRFVGPPKGALSVSFSSDGRMAITGGFDRTVQLWEVTTGNEIQQLIGHFDTVRSVTISPDRKYALTASFDKTSRVWDISTGKELRKFEGEYGPVAFSPNGLLAVTTIGPTVRLWEVGTGKEVLRLEGYSERVLAVAFSHNGSQTVTGNESGRMNLWNLQTGQIIQQLEGHSKNITSIAFLPDGNHILTGSRDKTARLWEMATGKEVKRLECASSPWAFSWDGQLILAGSENGASEVWETSTGKVTHRLEGHNGLIDAGAISADGKLAVTGSWDSTAQIWDLVTGKETHRLEEHSAQVTSVAFSPDSQHILTGSWDATARVWEASTGKQVQLLVQSDKNFPTITIPYGGSGAIKIGGKTDGITSVAFSSSGRLALTGNEDSTACVWDIQTGTCLQVLAGHFDQVFSAKFSPNGKLVMTGSLDGTTRLWKTETGEEICQMVSFKNGDWVVVAPDGRFDTNNLEECKGLHWVVDDNPLHPRTLDIVTFARDYYEPRLLARILNGEQFDPRSPLASLNHSLPKVGEAQVTLEKDKAGNLTGMSTVMVSVSNITSDSQKKEGQFVESGIFDLRLFRNGQIVGQYPEPDIGPVSEFSSKESEIVAWRTKAGIVSTAENQRVKCVYDSKTKTATLTFKHIQLPQGLDAPKVEFSAYAFNSDRLKSLTARTEVNLPKGMPIVQRKAYVISVGVSAYQTPNCNLNFAAADARQMQDTLAKQLAQSGVYQEIVPVTLVSDSKTDLSGKSTVTENTATKANFHTVMDLLSGKPVAKEAIEAIPNADKLQKARPEDLVVIFFSSHGYADHNGVFYLVPYDIGNSEACIVTKELLTYCISSDELSLWLRDVDGGDMAFIVDACHSAAAVEGKTFKPGPMGNRGLGQLSYDKGMWILAATQSDDVALEKQAIKHGLLTYALNTNGIEEKQADFKAKDGTIFLKEWLEWGVERVPKLHQEIKEAEKYKAPNNSLASDTQVKVSIDRTKKRLIEQSNSSPGVSQASMRSAENDEQLQRPVLFDFTHRKRDVVLAK